MPWIKDLILEGKLKKLGIKWEYKTVPIAEIDVQGSRQNNARVQAALIDDMVVDYGLAMLNGDQFPAVVVVKRGEKFFVLSGNHRVAGAIEADLKEVDAYILQTDDVCVAEIITRCANRWVGGRCSKQEAAQHALALVNQGVTKREAAELLGIKYEWFLKELRTDEIRNSLSRLGIDSRKLGRTAIEKLAPLTGNENVLREATRLLVTYRTSVDQQNEMIEALKMQKSELASMRVIQDCESQFRQEAPRVDVPVKQPTRRRFLQKFNGLLNVISGKRTLRELQVTSVEEQSDLLTKWEIMRGKLDTIFQVKIEEDVNGKAATKKAGNSRRVRIA